MRYVKYITGKGISVQLSISKSDQQFGFIPLCELFDLNDSNIAHLFAENAQTRVFAARVIDFENKTGKPILSSRASVTSKETWRSMSPEGTSLAFKQDD